MRQILLDTETTGLDPRQGHRILEIAAVEMVNRRLSPPDRHYHRYINPERDSDEGALQVHGLSSDFLADKPKFHELAHEFLAFVAGAEIIIHNAPFDVGFLNAEFERLGLGRFTDHVAGVVDTLAMAREIFPGKRNNLDALCDRFEIDRSARTLHGALIDCELLADVYLAMTRGQDSLMMEFALPDDGAGPAGQGAARLRQPRRLFTASAEDLAAHASYLDDLDKASKGHCLWRSLSAETGEVGA